MALSTSYRILNITWFLDSPFGTFLEGDFVAIYIEPDLTFTVYQNVTQITSGDEIPYQSWNHAGLPDTDYKVEEVEYASLCDDTSLLTFTRIAQFPYIQISTLTNHPSCVVPDPDAPLVCDITFTTLPTSTPVSSVAALDGTVTVTATSSNGSVKYKLNSDFVGGYNDPTAQTSGIFTGLGQGIYQVYARDEVNCLVVQTVQVTVETVSAYSTHYQLEFYNPCGHHIKTEILEKDYAGSIEEIKGNTQSTTIFDSRAEGEIDKFVSIVATEVLFRIISETNNQFVTLYTNDQEK
jgi:hypothetical protein